MALTLVEAAKLHSGDVYRQGVIEQFAASSGVLMVLPFQNILGNAYKYNREETLPGIGFRGVNEAYPESTGILNPITEPLVIAGGDLDVDRFITGTMGGDQRTEQERMKIKALALSWERTFFKGDQAVDPREYDGLQKRITGNQLIDAADTPSSGGNPLSLIKLDELIDTVQDPTHLFMNKRMFRILNAAQRNYAVYSAVQWQPDAFGRRIPTYNDLPIITITNDNNDQPIIGHNEVGAGGGAAVTTSIYCCSLGGQGVVGLQNGDMQVRDLGELETKPAERTRVEWWAGMAVLHGKSAARMRGINSGAVIA